jgi:hypothetical protein
MRAEGISRPLMPLHSQQRVVLESYTVELTLAEMVSSSMSSSASRKRAASSSLSVICRGVARI